MVKDLEFGTKSETAVMSWLSKIVCVWEYDIMISESELYIIFVDRENIAKDGSLQFL
jgi:hypothetical protein